MNRPADRWIGWTTTGCVGLLALIAGTVSYLHMHMLVELHGQPGWELQRQAWHWALDHRAGDGSLPSGREIADQYGRQERWGRLVKRAGTTGEFGSESSEPTLRLVGQRPPSAAGE